VHGKVGGSTQIYNSGYSLVAALTTDLEKGRYHAQPSIGTIKCLSVEKKGETHKGASGGIDSLDDRLFEGKKKGEQVTGCEMPVFQPRLKSSLSA